MPGDIVKSLKLDQIRIREQANQSSLSNFMKKIKK